jgi:hypothetical protein
LEKKLLSPIELLEFRAQQQEQMKNIALKLEEKKLLEQKKARKVLSPKEVLDAYTNHYTEFSKEEVISEEVKEPEDPIKILNERIEEVSASIKKPKYYDSEISQINNVISEIKKNISEIPEVKYYDEEIQFITSKLDSLDIRYYENDLNEINQKLEEFKSVEDQKIEDVRSILNQVLEDVTNLYSTEILDPTETNNYIESIKETFYEKLSEVKKEVSELPEVKYYDSELLDLKEKIENVKRSIPEIPEIKYYDEDLKNLLEVIENVRSNIPTVPEVRYYDNDILKLEETIQKVENRIPIVPEIKYYDKDISQLNEEIKNVKNQIPIVPEVRYYDNELIQLEDSIQKIENRISEIPEIKYYDDDLSDITSNILSLEKDLVEIKENVSQVKKSFNEKEPPKDWTDEINNIYDEIEKLKEVPVITESSDPLVPLDQNFATLDDLKNHYKLFINRIQQQLSSLGGGGETRLKYLDDIVGIATNASAYDGKFLKYNHSIRKFEFVTVSEGGGSSDLQSLNDVDVSNLNDGYLMIWNATASKFVFVSPQSIGINNDANIDTEITDYGTY